MSLLDPYRPCHLPRSFFVKAAASIVIMPHPKWTTRPAILRYQIRDSQRLVCPV